MRLYNKNRKHAMREKKLRARKWFMTKTARSLLLGLIVLFGVFYLAKVNSIATKGYQIAELDSQILELERKNDKLNFEIAKYKSMHSIQTRLQDLSMIPTAQIKYVDISGRVFARR
jgi:cell division protein FtsL